MLTTFFIVGGIWFWLLSAIVIVLLLWEVHRDRPILGLITVGLYLGMIHLFGDASLPSTINTSPWILYMGIPIYFLAGAIWGVTRWVLFVNRNAIEYKKYRKDFLTDRKNHPSLSGVTITEDTLVPEELREKWARRHNSFERPSARNNKWKIITWMCYWPFSMVWFAIDEPWRYIYDALSSMFQKISNKIYSRVGYDQDVFVTSREVRNNEGDDSYSSTD